MLNDSKPTPIEQALEHYRRESPFRVVDHNGKFEGGFGDRASASAYARKLRSDFGRAYGVTDSDDKLLVIFSTAGHTYHQ